MSKLVKSRLDVYFVNRLWFLPRAKAQALILAGQIKVNDVVVTKVGTLISTEAVVSVLSTQRYVSRGGEKLEGALHDFSISVQGLVCMDVGSSTGGFSDCLLQQGAQKVYSIDVGTAQMDSRLKS